MKSSGYVIPWSDFLTWIGPDLQDLTLDASSRHNGGFTSAEQLASVLLKYSNTLVKLDLTQFKAEGEDIHSFNYGIPISFSNLKRLQLYHVAPQIFGLFSVLDISEAEFLHSHDLKHGQESLDCLRGLFRSSHSNLTALSISLRNVSPQILKISSSDFRFCFSELETLVSKSDFQINQRFSRFYYQELEFLAIMGPEGDELKKQFRRNRTQLVIDTIN